MGYFGAIILDELRAKARSVRITAGSLKESHPQDVIITEEPVNYELHSSAGQAVTRRLSRTSCALAGARSGWR